MFLVVPYDLGDKMDSTKSYSRLCQARLRQDEVRQVILLAVPDSLKKLDAGVQAIVLAMTFSGFLWGWREVLGLACWRQLSMSKVWYSLGGAHTF